MINFDGLDVVTKTIYRVNSKFSLKNRVNLSYSQYSTNLRKNALYKYQTRNSKFADADSSVVLDLSDSNFLIFEYLDRSNNLYHCDQVYFTYNQMYGIFEAFSNMNEAVHSGELYLEVNEQIVISSEYENYKEEIQGIEKNIVMIPDIAILEEVQGQYTYQPAVSLYINSVDSIVTLQIPEFEALFHFLMNFDLLTSSQNLLIIAYLTQLGSSSNEMLSSTELSKKLQRKVSIEPSKNNANLIERLENE